MNKIEQAVERFRNGFNCSQAVLLMFLVLAIILPNLCHGQSQDSSAKPISALDSCTSIMVGRLASADGSTITSHTCDGYYRTWLNIVPHQKNGLLRSVFGAGSN